MSAYRRIADAAPDGAEGRSLTQGGHSAYSRFQPKGGVRRVGGTATARPFAPRNGSERDTALGGPVVFDNDFASSYSKLTTLGCEN